MRKLFLAAVALGAVAFAGVTASPVSARDYLATASGRLAYCDANPYFVDPNRADRTYPNRRHWHR